MRLTQRDLHLDDVDGLSGLSADGEGRLWAVPERRALLLRLDSPRVEQYPITGVPAGLDLESLGWLRDRRFAIGTESQETPRSAELVLVVERQGERARVTDTIQLPYANLPISAERNRGIEGLCAAEEHLLAAFEQVVTQGGKRYAVLVHREPRGELHTLKLALTSDTGKISGLDCRMKPGALEVFAIERHFGVRRLLTFEVPLAGAEQPLAAHVALALEPLLPAELNPEGIVRRDDGFLLVNDNHYGRRTGPSELLRFTFQREQRATHNDK